jgi:hypothetical protein
MLHNIHIRSLAVHRYNLVLTLPFYIAISYSIWLTFFHVILGSQSNVIGVYTVKLMATSKGVNASSALCVAGGSNLSVFPSPVCLLRSYPLFYHCGGTHSLFGGGVIGVINPMSNIR